MKNLTVNHVKETQASALNHGFSKQINQASTKVSSEVSGELTAIFDMLTLQFIAQLSGSKTVVLHHSSFLFFCTCSDCNTAI